MARNIIGLLIFSLGLLATACSDQGAFGPSGGDDRRPALKATNSDTTMTTTGKKGGPGGSAGGFK